MNDELQKKRDPDQSEIAFYLLFSVQLVLIAIGIFVPIRMGVTTLPLVIALSMITLMRCTGQETDWKRGQNVMFGLFMVWGAYCLFEIGNPNHVQAAWNIAITHYWVYPLVFAFVVPLAIRNYKGIEWLLLIWSVFVLIAAFKGYWQKSHGFNAKELYFLYTLGGYRTHLIWSGIRYFSCFPDAANFGVHSAMAVTTFGIATFYVRKRWMKVYFAIIAICAIYGMGISGTRAAMAVPFGGIALFILVSKSWKSFAFSTLAFIAVFSFFNFTTIGDGNQYIRKMRSAFRPSEDASYQVRVENRKKMKGLMDEKSIGYGIGLSKGAQYGPKEVMPYPPDSWLVAVWVETGIVGLMLYLLIHGVLFAWCSWLLMFRIMNQRLRGLLAAWLCMNAGFFIAAYANDVMQYPNSIIVYTGFALCIAGPYIDPVMQKEDEELERERKEKKKRD